MENCGDFLVWFGFLGRCCYLDLGGCVFSSHSCLEQKEMLMVQSEASLPFTMLWVMLYSEMSSLLHLYLTTCLTSPSAFVMEFYKPLEQEKWWVSLSDRLVEVSGRGRHMTESQDKWILFLLSLRAAAHLSAPAFPCPQRQQQWSRSTVQSFRRHRRRATE